MKEPNTEEKNPPNRKKKKGKEKPAEDREEERYEGKKKAEKPPFENSNRAACSLRRHFLSATNRKVETAPRRAFQAGALPVAAAALENLPFFVTC